MIFHISIDMECRVCYCLHAHLDMALFYVHHSLFNCLCHFESLEDHRQSSSAENGHVYLLAVLKALSLVKHSHFEEFVH
jgi:hypothetical protein